MGEYTRGQGLGGEVSYQRAGILEGGVYQRAGVGIYTQY